MVNKDQLVALAFIAQGGTPDVFLREFEEFALNRFPRLRLNHRAAIVTMASAIVKNPTFVSTRNTTNPIRAMSDLLDLQMQTLEALNKVL